MSQKSRLRQQKIALEQQWEVAHKKANKMRQMAILETRPEEKLRLEALVRQAETDRDNIEKKLGELEKEPNSLEVTNSYNYEEAGFVPEIEPNDLNEDHSPSALLATDKWSKEFSTSDQGDSLPVNISQSQQVNSGGVIEKSPQTVDIEVDALGDDSSIKQEQEAADRGKIKKSGQSVNIRKSG